jgi:hypothetical protein
MKWADLLLALPKIIGAIGKLFEAKDVANVESAVKKAAESGDTSDLNRLTNEVRRSK